MDKKNTMLLTVIAVATLLVAVVGATFAYFSITSNQDTTPTTVTGETEAVGTVALNNETSAMHLSLTAADMAEANKGTSYYATTETAQNYDTTKTDRSIAKATVTGGEATTKYKCTAKINFKLTGDMATLLQTGDGTISLTNGTNATAESTSVDLKEIADAGTDGKNVNVTYNLTGTATDEIKAAVAINNLDKEQNYLSGKSFNLVIVTNDFACDTVDSFDTTGGTDVTG